MSYSDVGERGVAVNFEKTQFFLNTLYLIQVLPISLSTIYSLTNGFPPGDGWPGVAGGLAVDDQAGEVERRLVHRLQLPVRRD